MNQSDYPIYTALSIAAKTVGLACRGGFHPTHDDGVPVVQQAPARTVVLLGFTGREQWSTFATSTEFSDGLPHPLDRWSQRVMSILARQFGAAALYPFTGPPWWPFQRWAKRAERLYESPLGILMHADYGLWHAYRGALLLKDEIDIPPIRNWPNPCESCRTRPCLSACPAGALSGGRYAAETCREHLLADHHTNTCSTSGCLARYACPVAAEHRYSSAQASFHVQAFINAGS